METELKYLNMDNLKIECKHKRIRKIFILVHLIYTVTSSPLKQTT